MFVDLAVCSVWPVNVYINIKHISCNIHGYHRFYLEIMLKTKGLYAEYEHIYTRIMPQPPSMAYLYREM